MKTKKLKIKDPVNYPTVLKIATRAEKLLGLAKIHFVLDIQAVKADIDWEMLLAANDFNFMHDMAGINKHLDHDTGELTNFIPRYHAYKNHFVPRLRHPKPKNEDDNILYTYEMENDDLI